MRPGATNRAGVLPLPHRGEGRGEGATSEMDLSHGHSGRATFGQLIGSRILLIHWPESLSSRLPGDRVYDSPLAAEKKKLKRNLTFNPPLPGVPTEMSELQRSVR